MGRARAVRFALLLAASTPLAGCVSLRSLLGIPDPLVPGQRVRVTVPDSTPPRRTGRLLALTRDSVVLGADSTGAAGEDRVTGRTAFARDSVSQLEVSRGIHRDVVTGTLFGSLVATFGGLAILCTRVHTCLGRGTTDPPLSQGFTIIMVSVGTGALIGGTVGAFLRSEHWDPVPDQDLSAERVGPQPPDLRFQAGLRLYPAFLDSRRSSRR